MRMGLGLAKPLATYGTSSENPAKAPARRLLVAIVVVLIVIVGTFGSIIAMGVYDLSAFTVTNRSTTIVNGSIVVPAGHYPGGRNEPLDNGLLHCVRWPCKRHRSVCDGPS